MTLAEIIYDYIAAHGSATRPDIAKLTGAPLKAVEAATRKLEALGVVFRDDMEGKRVVFRMKEGEHDLELIGDRRGRPNGSQNTVHESCIALSSVMNAFFGK